MAWISPSAQVQRLQIGHGRDHEHAGGCGDQSRRGAHRQAQRAFAPRGNGGWRTEQAPGRVQDQRDAQAYACPDAGWRAQPPGARQRAGASARLHAGDAAPDRAEGRGGPSLPQVGDQRWHHQQRGGLRGRHDQRQQGHGNGGQPQPDHALDHAGQEDGRRRGRQQRCGAGHHQVGGTHGRAPGGQRRLPRLWRRLMARQARQDRNSGWTWFGLAWRTPE